MTVDTFCTSCGQPRAADAQFCIGCGQSFGSPGAPVVTAVPAITSPGPQAAAAPSVVPLAVEGAPSYGSFVRRVAAYLIDTVVITVITGAIGGGQNVTSLPLLSAVYFIGFWGSTGRTIGMLALGLRVTRVGGQRVGYGPAFIRYLGLLLALVILLLGVLLILFDPRRQGLHDKLAGTIVVRV